MPTQHSVAHWDWTSKQELTHLTEEQWLSQLIWKWSTQTIWICMPDVPCNFSTKFGSTWCNTLEEEGKKEFTAGKKITLALEKQLKEETTSSWKSMMSLKNPVSAEKEQWQMITWCLRCLEMRDVHTKASSFTWTNWIRTMSSFGNDQMCTADTQSLTDGMTKWRLVSTAWECGWKKSLLHHAAAKSTPTTAFAKPVQQLWQNLDFKHLKLHLWQSTEVWSHWNPTSNIQLWKKEQGWQMLCVSTPRRHLQTRQKRKACCKKWRPSSGNPSKK